MQPTKMLPNLSALHTNSPSYKFVDRHDTTIIVLEQRDNNTVALVGAKGSQKLQLSVPILGAFGSARAVLDGKLGICSDAAGIVATRNFIVTAHNKGIVQVLQHDGYLIATFNV